MIDVDEDEVCNVTDEEFVEYINFHGAENVLNKLKESIDGGNNMSETHNPFKKIKNKYESKTDEQKHKIKKGVIIGASATAVVVGGAIVYHHHHNRDGALTSDINDSYAAW